MGGETSVSFTTNHAQRHLVVLYCYMLHRWCSDKRENIAGSLYLTDSTNARYFQLMYFVPLYFQITGGVSSTLAGLHLVPGVVGNAVGGLVAGHFIRRQVYEFETPRRKGNFVTNIGLRTGGYKAVILASSLFASIGYALLIIRWSGNTNWWESLYIFLG